jgi:hypothetical protein
LPWKHLKKEGTEGNLTEGFTGWCDGEERLTAERKKWRCRSSSAQGLEHGGEEMGWGMATVEYGEVRGPFYRVGGWEGRRCGAVRGTAGSEVHH